MIPKEGVQVEDDWGGYFEHYTDPLRFGDSDKKKVFGGKKRQDLSGVIIELQRDLLGIGYSVKVNGEFDEYTRQAVDRFKRHFFTGTRKANAPKSLAVSDRIDKDTANMIVAVRMGMPGAATKPARAATIRVLTADESKTVARALQAEKQKLAQSLQAIDRWNTTDQDLFAKVFRESTEVARGHVKAVFDRMVLQNQCYAADNSRVDSADPGIAYVHGDDPETIYLTSRFFDLAEASQAATLIHERSHFDSVASTDDFSKPAETALMLDLPETKALANAQSYAVYASCIGRSCF